MKNVFKTFSAILCMRLSECEIIIAAGIFVINLLFAGWIFLGEYDEKMIGQICLFGIDFGFACYIGSYLMKFKEHHISPWRCSTEARNSMMQELEDDIAYAANLCC